MLHPVSAQAKPTMPVSATPSRGGFANRSIPALQDKNPSAPIAKRKNTCPIRFFFCHRRRKRKSYKKRKRRWGDFALCGARPSPPTARAAFWKRRAKTLIWSKSFRSAFFSILCNKIDKNAQNRRISVSSPYNRTAETDFGERKSEYNKTQATRKRAACLPFNRYWWKF